MAAKTRIGRFPVAWVALVLPVAIAAVAAANLWGQYAVPPPATASAAETIPIPIAPAPQTVAVVEAEPLPAETPEPTSLDDEAAAEILRIRQRQGDLLQGTLLQAFSGSNESEAAEFARILQRVVEQAQHEPRFTSYEGQSFSDVPLPQGSDPALVSAVRHAGRELERKAADLEQAREYGQADQLRHQAQQLWSLAREFDR